MLDEIILSLRQIGAIQFGQYTLKSGATTSVYVNLRKIISYPDLMRKIARAMWQEIAASPFDVICGVPYTALPIATCLSLDQNIPMVMRRKERKDYGTKQMIEGVYQAGQRCAIIEDVITKGQSVIETAKELETCGLFVNPVVALIDREQGGKANLVAAGYDIKTLFSLPTILHTLLSSQTLDNTEADCAERYLAEHAA